MRTRRGRSLYGDFRPTLAREKLEDLHGVTASVETLRQWMMLTALGAARRPSRAAHPPRSRSPRCTLLVFVDDAASRLMHLRFAATCACAVRRSRIRSIQ